MKKKIFFVLLMAMASVIPVSAKSSDSKAIDEKVEEILKTLTLREKIAKSFVITVNAQNGAAS